jgi:hypothetical protein
MLFWRKSGHYAPGLSFSSVDEAVKKLTELEPSPDIVIIQCLDNNMYFVAGDDGSLALPVRAKDGKYHVCGELRVATKDQAGCLLTTIEPLLKTLPDVKKIVLSPLPHYSLVGQSCCARTDHMTNMGPDLAGIIRTGLANMKKTARSFLFKNKISGVCIIDPGTMVDVADPVNFKDPVHLTAAAYGLIAEGLKMVLSGTSEEDNSTDPSSGGASKRIRTVSATSGRGGYSADPHSGAVDSVPGVCLAGEGDGDLVAGPGGGGGNRLPSDQDRVYTRTVSTGFNT